jgi:hypothetical protein
MSHPPSVLSQEPTATQIPAPTREPADDAPPPGRSSAEPGRHQGISRRALGAAALAAIWAGAGKPRRAAAAGPSEVSADVDPNALLVKLVRRITQGFSQTEYNLALSMGYSGYLEYHLNHLAISEDPSLTTKLSGLSTLNMTAYQILQLVNQGQAVAELSEACIQRAVYSKRQLFERMVEFWTDHFTIDIAKEIDRALKPVDDRLVIRANALGTFPALLSASAHSPAMLYYLDNQDSIAGNPNENYARELMELHTMGVDGGYTQQDVENVARCFTGWTLVPPRGANTLAGTFTFNPAVHDNGQKTVLGHVIPGGGGQIDGETVLNILIDHPSTARYISKKLCSWLLQENPPQSIVNDVAATYTATRGDIRAMIRTCLKASTLAEAAPKYKRPFHHAVSAMRALPTTMNLTQAVRQHLLGSGHHPYFWPTPDGYPDKLDYWVGLVLPRWNFGASLLNGNLNATSVNTTAFFAGTSTAEQMADKINAAMFGGELPQAERDRIRDYLLPDPPTASRKQEAIGLAIGAPSFQWY